jgi:hypothetical protein
LLQFLNIYEVSHLFNPPSPLLGVFTIAVNLS